VRVDVATSDSVRVASSEIVPERDTRREKERRMVMVDVSVTLADSVLVEESISDAEPETERDRLAVLDGDSVTVSELDAVWDAE
jgi:hypothetical protein